MTPYPDEPMFKGIGNFQKDNDLYFDRIMSPGGETESGINKALAKKKSSSNQKLNDGRAFGQTTVKLAAIGSDPEPEPDPDPKIDKNTRFKILKYCNLKKKNAELLRLHQKLPAGDQKDLVYTQMAINEVEMIEIETELANKNIPISCP